MGYMNRYSNVVSYTMLQYIQLLEKNQQTTATNLTNLENGISLLNTRMLELDNHAFNSPINNLTTTEDGYALDARQGNVLDTRVSALETPTFTQATSRTNIASGNTMPTILGKIMKYFTDLKSHAFNSLANNLATTTTGYALDATQGKALNDKLGSTDISTIGDGTVTNAISTLNSNLYSLIVVSHQYPLGVVECSLDLADNAVYNSVEDYTVTVPEGYKFLFGIWSIAWTNSHAIPNFVFEHQFEMDVSGKMSVIKIDPNLPVPSFVPQMLCVFVKK